MKVWLDNDKRIMHEFYEKPMKNDLVIHKESAIPYKSKMKTLTQEVFRRIHNTDDNI